jgi:hypothetical protein
MSEPAGASSSRPRSVLAIRASPVSRQPGSARRRTATLACPNSVCATLMSATEEMPDSTRRT